LPSSCPTLFPYTTLFRSSCDCNSAAAWAFLELFSLPQTSISHDEDSPNSYWVTLSLMPNPWASDNLATVAPAFAFRVGKKAVLEDRKSTRLNSSHVKSSY